jgi:hypothetical protein
MADRIIAFLANEFAYRHGFVEREGTVTPAGWNNTKSRYAVCCASEAR